MHRRDFLQRMSAAAAVPWLAGAEDLDQLRRGLAVARDDDAFWREVRSQFLLRPGLVYMNAATSAPLPGPW